MARSKSIEIQEVSTSLIPARRLNRPARARNAAPGAAGGGDSCRQGPGAPIGAGQVQRRGRG
jgi:hypothetical protein